MGVTFEENYPEYVEVIDFILDMMPEKGKKRKYNEVKNYDKNNKSKN